jgi:non-heme chloroperoxidase
MIKFNSNYIPSFDQKKLFFQTSFNQNEVPSKIIMLNYGLVCSNHHWSMQIDYFTQRGYGLILHDYRGHFNSSGLDDIPSITFKNIATDMKSILDFLQIKSHVIMFGHSMGVNTTLEFARQYPDYISSMVLIGGTVLPVTEVMFDSNVMDMVLPYVKMLVNKYPKESEFIWKTSGLNPIIQKIIMSGGFNESKVSKEFIQIYLNRIGQLKPELFFQLFDQMTVHDVIAYLEKIKTRALIIAGEKDKVIPFHVQEIIHQKLPNSEFYMVKDGSHVPQVDFPEQINERIELFIQSI